MDQPIMNDGKVNRWSRRVFSKYKSRAKGKGIVFSLSQEEFASLISKPCVYCGSEASNSLSYLGSEFRYNGVDRVDSKRGYESGNVVSCCRFCNSLKGSMKWETWAHFLASVIRAHQGKVPELLGQGSGDEDRASKSFYAGR